MILFCHNAQPMLLNIPHKRSVPKFRVDWRMMKKTFEEVCAHNCLREPEYECATMNTTELRPYRIQCFDMLQCVRICSTVAATQMLQWCTVSIVKTITIPVVGHAARHQSCNLLVPNLPGEWGPRLSIKVWLRLRDTIKCTGPHCQVTHSQRPRGCIYGDQLG